MEQQAHHPSQQAALNKEIEALSIHCFACRATEEDNRVQILIDLSDCAKSICCVCYAQLKGETCTRCAKKIQLHHPRKNRNTIYARALEQAKKVYNRELKIWSTEEYKQLDTDLVGLLSYFALNPPQKSSRKSYEEAEREIKGMLKRKNRQDKAAIETGDRQSYQVSQAHQFRQATLVSHSKDEMATGKEATGYNDKDYSKGFALIRGCQW